MPRIGIHIFRKDLRICDNLALNQLSKTVDQVVGLFIFDPQQIDQTSSNKSHRSIYAAQFIVDAVNDLNGQCDKKLIVAYGKPEMTIEALLISIKPSSISFNADFTPYSLKRDSCIKTICEKHHVDCIINYDDQCLTEMNSLLKKDGTPYMVFGTFYKHLKNQSIKNPKTIKINWTKPRVSIQPFEWKKQLTTTMFGGRSEALRLMKAYSTSTDSDLLTTNSSKLSAYLNQGCVSIREVYSSLNRKGIQDTMRSVAWRDFFLCIYRFTENGNSYTKFIDNRYNQIKWPKIKLNEWRRFMTCDTGFLMIDAIMAELLQTGYINNRARLLLGTFWIKYLLINPFDKEYGSQEGFSRLLVDCSSSQNKLNHQWLMGDLDFAGRRFGMRGSHPLTGRMIRCDNDLIKKFDPNYEYISKWLPQFHGKTIKECKAMMKETNPMYQWRERYTLYTNLFKTIDK